jgi:hypothetical protein
MTDAPKRRRWLRYGLITLLVLVAATGIAMTWMVQKMQRTLRQNEAAETIVNAGGKVRFDFENGKRRQSIGDDLGAYVVEAEVPTDDALRGIKNLPRLRFLLLSSKGITDAAIPHVAELNQLERLCLNDTKITEEGVERLRKALPKCEIVR